MGLVNFECVSRNVHFSYTVVSFITILQSLIGSKYYAAEEGKIPFYVIISCSCLATIIFIILCFLNRKASFSKKILGILTIVGGGFQAVSAVIFCTFFAFVKSASKSIVSDAIIIATVPLILIVIASIIIGTLLMVKSGASEQPKPKKGKK